MGIQFFKIENKNYPPFSWFREFTFPIERIPLFGEMGTSMDVRFGRDWRDRAGMGSPIGEVIMGSMASQLTSLTIVYSTVYSAADQRKHQSSASLAFVRGIHRGLVNSTHKWPVTRKMFPFDDVIMKFEPNPSSLYRIAWELVDQWWDSRGTAMLGVQRGVAWPKVNQASSSPPPKLTSIRGQFGGLKSYICQENRR